MNIRAVVAIIFALTLIAASQQPRQLLENKGLTEGIICQYPDIDPINGSNWDPYIISIDEIDRKYKNTPITLIGYGQNNEEVYNETEYWDGENNILTFPKVIPEKLSEENPLGKIHTYIIAGSTYQGIGGPDIELHFIDWDVKCGISDSKVTLDMISDKKWNVTCYRRDKGKPIGSQEYNKTAMKWSLIFKDPDPAGCNFRKKYNFTYSLI